MRRFQETLDEAAFRTILSRYQGPASSIAQGRLRDAAAAQDAVQETLIRIVKERDRYDPQRPFAPWFYTVLRNVCEDHRRREARYREKLEEVAECAMSDSPGPSAPAAVFDLVSGLDQADQELLILRFLHGLSFDEIAEHLDCSLDAAKKRGQRALRRLRRQMADCGSTS